MCTVGVPPGQGGTGLESLTFVTNPAGSNDDH